MNINRHGIIFLIVLFIIGFTHYALAPYFTAASLVYSSSKTGIPDIKMEHWDLMDDIYLAKQKAFAHQVQKLDGLPFVIGKALESTINDKANPRRTSYDQTEKVTGTLVNAFFSPLVPQAKADSITSYLNTLSNVWSPLPLKSPAEIRAYYDNGVLSPTFSLIYNEDNYTYFAIKLCREGIYSWYMCRISADFKRDEG